MMSNRLTNIVKDLPESVNRLLIERVTLFMAPIASTSYFSHYNHLVKYTLLSPSPFFLQDLLFRGISAEEKSLKLYASRTFVEVQRKLNCSRARFALSRRLRLYAYDSTSSDI